MYRQNLWFKVFLLVLSSLLLSQCSLGQEKAAAEEATAPPTEAEAPVDTPAAPSSGSLAPGDTALTVNTGVERTSLLHVPPGYDPASPAPLVIVLHGFSLKAEDMVRISGFNNLADKAGFLVAYPQGLGEKSAWNGGDCCGQAAVKKVDDVGFIRQLIDEVMAIANVDPGRVYATGFSNGAIMAYRLACDLSDRIASVAPVAAAMEYPSCDPPRTVSVMHFHGTSDRLNPYEGGQGSTGGLSLNSVSNTIAFWVQQDECPAQPSSETKGSITHDTYAPCAGDAAVELYTIEGGEHAWPGGEAVTEQIGKPNMEISATDLMWAFFSAHPMP